MNKSKTPYVVAIAAQKGGVGKSTIACNLAVCFAKEGLNVELVDADTQGSAMIFRNLRNDRGVDDFVASANATKTIFKDIEKKRGYDIVIIDSGGRDTAVMRGAIMAASYGMLIIPFLASQFDFSALTDTLNILEEARALNIDINAFILHNRVDERKRITQEANEELENLKKEYKIKVFNAALGNRNDFITSIMEGKGVTEIKSRDNKAKREMEELFAEIKKELKE
jgi:chromosome partitioning protein